MQTHTLSPARLIRAARHRLDALLADDGHYSPFAADIVNVAKAVQLACAQNRNVALAQILVDQHGAYPARHACDVATVVELVLTRLGRPRAERLPVIAAALTMNVGMQSLQTALASQTTPLSAEQRESMQQHPQHSRDLLRLRGVADTLWLDCVLQHHEAPDGSGYPQQLKGDAIRFEARLLGLADRYCAMLTQSAWRHAQRADTALKQSLADGVDAKLARLFTETVGVFPPGATVTLANGETAIIRETAGRDDAPIAVAYLDHLGQTLSLPVSRDTALPAYRVAAVIDTAKLALGAGTVWGNDAV
ncbi:HD-GYP domain-containing protein [Jeongeupia naejangsanensis]|uniref:HD domain-containing protein n=1 Tax=Jeongeupia naejangsanensis TaxID=613195 RepID=A0ABS2BKK1_9NEIS|nr:HD domain-containing phosphohydrolase [Jeongeupia naejangsanensis]MBM3116113.1 HD domain-containing protein [Jeongeupia naejangsanensis]